MLGACFQSHDYSEYQAKPFPENMALRDAERAQGPEIGLPKTWGVSW